MLLYFRAKALYSNITNTGIDSLSANLTKCSNTLKQLVENLLPNCFSVFDHFVDLVLKRLREKIWAPVTNRFPNKKTSSAFGYISLKM